MDDGSGTRSKLSPNVGFIMAPMGNSSANDADDQVRIELGLAFESRSVGRVVSPPLTLPSQEASRTIELYPRCPDTALRVVSWPKTTEAWLPSALLA
jgi:hypothetical protein